MGGVGGSGPQKSVGDIDIALTQAQQLRDLGKTFGQDVSGYSLLTDTGQSDALASLFSDRQFQPGTALSPGASVDETQSNQIASLFGSSPASSGEIAPLAATATAPAATASTSTVPAASTTTAPPTVESVQMQQLRDLGTRWGQDLSGYNMDTDAGQSAAIQAMYQGRTIPTSTPLPTGLGVQETQSAQIADLFNAAATSPGSQGYAGTPGQAGGQPQGAQDIQAQQLRDLAASYGQDISGMDLTTDAGQSGAISALFQGRTIPAGAALAPGAGVDETQSSQIAALFGAQPMTPTTTTAPPPAPTTTAPTASTQAPVVSTTTPATPGAAPPTIAEYRTPFQDESVVRSAMTPFLSGVPGDSALTRSAISAWEKNVKPTLENEYTLMGLGSSPALGQAMSDSLTAEMPKLIQSDLANRFTAADTLGGIERLRQGAWGMRQGDTGLEQSASDLASRISDREATRKLESYGTVGDLLLRLADPYNYAIQAQQAQQGIALQGYGAAGDLQQGTAQGALDAAELERLRLQGLSEGSTLGLFSSVLPPSLQQRIKSSGGK